MDILINIILLLTGFVGAIAAIGGDTWHKGSEPVFQRITNRGWLSIIALVITLSLGIVKEVRSIAATQKAEISQKKLQEELTHATESLAATREHLAKANQKLDAAQISLASIEPEILEGMFQLTERIPREQDFAFANVSGENEVIPISSETRKQLILYGGDVFEWHHFCKSYTEFILKTGFRDYPLNSKEGKIRISGPIGQKLYATISNPMRDKNCGFKIVVQSTDRTRTKSQFEPLLNKIREAKAALN